VSDESFNDYVPFHNHLFVFGSDKIFCQGRISGHGISFTGNDHRAFILVFRGVLKMLFDELSNMSSAMLAGIFFVATIHFFGEAFKGFQNGKFGLGSYYTLSGLLMMFLFIINSMWALT